MKPSKIMYRTTSTSLLKFLVSLFCLLILVNNVYSQEDDKYFLNQDDRLEIIVHVIGEVKRAGKYTVTDNTNLMELIAEAGGPTEFTNLKALTITRINPKTRRHGRNSTNGVLTENEIIKYNAEDFLRKSRSVTPPILEPGDIVFVPRNSWHKWRQTFTVIRDVSVLAGLYLLYLRVD